MLVFKNSNGDTSSSLEGGLFAMGAEAAKATQWSLAVPIAHLYVQEKP